MGGDLRFAGRDAEQRQLGDAVRGASHDVRIGFEDVLTGPEGQPVKSNAELLAYL